MTENTAAPDAYAQYHIMNTFYAQSVQRNVNKMTNMFSLRMREDRKK